MHATADGGRSAGPTGNTDGAWFATIEANPGSDVVHGDMIYRSPHPDIEIPAQAFSEFVLDESRAAPTTRP